MCLLALKQINLSLAIYKPSSKCNIFNFQENISIKLDETRHQFIGKKQITPIRSEQAINVIWKCSTFPFIKLWPKPQTFNLYNKRNSALEFLIIFRYRGRVYTVNIHISLLEIFSAYNFSFFLSLSSLFSVVSPEIKNLTIIAITTKFISVLSFPKVWDNPLCKWKR